MAKLLITRHLLEQAICMPLGNHIVGATYDEDREHVVLEVEGIDVPRDAEQVVLVVQERQGALTRA